MKFKHYCLTSGQLGLLLGIVFGLVIRSLIYCSVGNSTSNELNESQYKIGSCYENALGDEAIKVIGIVDGRVYYKHSWNSQDLIFNRSADTVPYKNISCGKDGYEFKLIEYRINRAERDIKFFSEKK